MIENYDNVRAVLNELRLALKNLRETGSMISRPSMSKLPALAAAFTSSTLPTRIGVRKPPCFRRAADSRIWLMTWDIKPLLSMLMI